jgi:hypothetical protein
MIDTSHTAGIQTLPPSDVRREHYPWTTQVILKIEIISHISNRSLDLIKTLLLTHICMPKPGTFTGTNG